MDCPSRSPLSRATITGGYHSRFAGAGTIAPSAGNSCAPIARVPSMSTRATEKGAALKCEATATQFGRPGSETTHTGRGRTRTRRSPSRRTEPPHSTRRGSHDLPVDAAPRGPLSPARASLCATPVRAGAGDGTGTRMANSGESLRTEFWLALEHARCIPVRIRNGPPQRRGKTAASLLRPAWGASTPICVGMTNDMPLCGAWEDSESTHAIL